MTVNLGHACFTAALTSAGELTSKLHHTSGYVCEDNLKISLFTTKFKYQHISFYVTGHLLSHITWRAVIKWPCYSKITLLS